MGSVLEGIPRTHPNATMLALVHLATLLSLALNAIAAVRISHYYNIALDLSLEESSVC